MYFCYFCSVKTVGYRCNTSNQMKYTDVKSVIKAQESSKGAFEEIYTNNVIPIEVQSIRNLYPSEFIPSVPHLLTQADFNDLIRGTSKSRLFTTAMFFVCLGRKKDFEWETRLNLNVIGEICKRWLKLLYTFNLV